MQLFYLFRHIYLVWNTPMNASNDNALISIIDSSFSVCSFFILSLLIFNTVNQFNKNFGMNIENLGEKQSTRSSMIPWESAWKLRELQQESDWLSHRYNFTYVRARHYYSFIHEHCVEHTRVTRTTCSRAYVYRVFCLNFPKERAQSNAVSIIPALRDERSPMRTMFHSALNIYTEKYSWIWRYHNFFVAATI